MEENETSINDLIEKRNQIYNKMIASGLNLTEEQWKLVIEFVKVNKDIASLTASRNLEENVNLKSEKISEGSQSIVYKTSNNQVYKEFKPDTEHPFDYDALEIMCGKLGNLKRINIPISLKYDADGKIIGSLENFVQNEDIKLENVHCRDLYKWYIEVLEDMEKLTYQKIKGIDISSDNIVLNKNGLFIIDIGCFEYHPNESIEEIRKSNIEEINFVFLYGLIWKVCQFASRQSFAEIFSEIKDFDGTIFQYLQYKNPYEYANDSKIENVSGLQRI